MKKNNILLSIALAVCNPISVFAASTDCFIAAEGDKVLVQEGNCDQRHAPCSTFKIAISLMGYNEGILVDETHPELPFKGKKGSQYLAEWENTQTPTSWMKYSCVWYSQFITEKLGMQKFKDYVTKFAYGNQDVSGDKGQNNGLTHSWLSSSLQISPKEQIDFLQKLTSGKLTPLVNHKAQELTKNILYREDLANGWKLYGKTGTGHTFIKNSDCKTKACKEEELSIGWFIGWIQKDARKIVFAYYTEFEKKQDSPVASKVAMQKACERLNQLTQAPKAAATPTNTKVAPDSKPTTNDSKATNTKVAPDNKTTNTKAAPAKTNK